MDAIIYQIKAEFLKVLAHPMRLRIIQELKAGEKSGSQLVKILKVGQPTISHHLTALRGAGILRSRQKGANVYYEVCDRSIFALVHLIAGILKKKLLNSASVLSDLDRN